MNREFVAKEIKKIIQNKQFEFPQNMAMAATWILGNLKGINLKIFDLKSTSDLCEYYVIGSATNITQAKAMADEILFHLKQHGLSIKSKEGLIGSDWILLDLSDIIVHIFLESARETYALEQLWKGAKTLKIPNEYYFSSENTEAAEKLSDDKNRDYF